jgi:hypothetical protein
MRVSVKKKIRKRRTHIATHYNIEIKSYGIRNELKSYVILEMYYVTGKLLQKI